jgi:hypothetical protein
VRLPASGKKALRPFGSRGICSPESIAGLMLGRASGQSREFAVRTALEQAGGIWYGESSKLKVVFKELNETTIWLEVIAESSLLSPEKIVAIVAENREVCRIIAASIKTARASTD